MRAARDYKAYLDGTLKRAPATVNAALAAVSDLAVRRSGPPKPARPATGPWPR